MTWKLIRLELVRTPDYPQGSPANAYVIRLPIDDNGALEKHILRDPDQRPVVRRFWLGEAGREKLRVRSLSEALRIAWIVEQADDPVVPVPPALLG